MTFFGLKSGQDLEDRAAYPHQDFPGVPPWPSRSSGDGPCRNIGTLPARVLKQCLISLQVSPHYMVAEGAGESVDSLKSNGHR